MSIWELKRSFKDYLTDFINLMLLIIFIEKIKLVISRFTIWSDIELHFLQKMIYIWQIQ